MSPHDSWPQGLRRTKQRLAVLKILQEAERPMSAAMIASAMQSDGATNWFSTVYRVLDAFMAHDMVVETSVSGSDVKLYELKREDHHHYIICVKCHKMVPLEDCPLDEILGKVEGFRILDHRLEISGICDQCAR